MSGTVILDMEADSLAQIAGNLFAHLLCLKYFFAAFRLNSSEISRMCVSINFVL